MSAQSVLPLQSIVPAHVVPTHSVIPNPLPTVVPKHFKAANPQAVQPIATVQAMQPVLPPTIQNATPNQPPRIIPNILPYTPLQIEFIYLMDME